MKKIGCNWFGKILFSFLIIKVYAVQRFAELPTYTEVNPGEDALLKCRISDKKGICSWQKDNKPVGIYRGKYEWAHEEGALGGDCSLWVRAASLQLDDGQWQCQVTASNYDVQDALSSPPAAFAVRVPPQTPRIMCNGSHILPGQNVTVSTGTRATVVCEARYGNPPAYIEWYLDQERLTAWSQTNSSEAERPRVWAARSVLELVATRTAHGRKLTCRARHPSFPAPYYRDSYTILDVAYSPSVSIFGADVSSLNNLEEGASALNLECRADGNPSPYVWWLKDGQVTTASGPKLMRAPVTRNDSGIYSCQAKNSLGTSKSVKIEINIKYPPRVTWVGPHTVVDASLFSSVTLECKADGNPAPTYQWYHNPDPSVQVSPQDGYPLSATPQLLLHNISYSQHGEYTCVATNQIGLEDRSHQSEPITVNVLGPPVGAEAGAAHAWSGAEARVQAAVCADPPPRRAAWLWGSLRLDVPSQSGRYKAEKPTSVNGCYRYSLLISSTAAADARAYVLHVENERGYSSHQVSLTVHDSFSLTETAHVAPLIVAALVMAALLVILLCVVVRCRRRRESVEYKAKELDGEKGALPADAVYAAREGRALPSAMRGSVAGVREGAGALARGAEPDGARYSPAALQAALKSLEREAKENVYAVLDPHVQYELTINNHGEPPKYLSLSKPLTHQRTHAFDPKNIAAYNINNNNVNENRFTTFKTGPPIVRRSDRSSYRKNNKNQHNYVCKTNYDVQYSRDPAYGMNRYNRSAANNNAQRNDRTDNRDIKTIRMYERTNSGRRKCHIGQDEENNNYIRNEGNQCLNFETIVKEDRQRTTTEKERLFEEYKLQYRNDQVEELPRPGKVREIASKFNRNSSSNDGNRQSVNLKTNRPKPLQTCDQAYLDHVFPDAVEL